MEEKEAEPTSPADDDFLLQTVRPGGRKTAETVVSRGGECLFFLSQLLSRPSAVD